MKIYVIRHGETDWNKLKKIQGQTDTLLNSTGKNQALIAKQEFEKLNIELIICSPLKRAVETANIINSDKKLPIIYNDSLKERFLGDFEGTISKIKNNNIYNYKINSKINNIESATELFDRVSKLLNNIKKIYKDKSILLVTHGGTARAIEAYFYGIADNGDFPPENLKNCEIREYFF